MDRWDEESPLFLKLLSLCPGLPKQPESDREVLPKPLRPSAFPHSLRSPPLSTPLGSRGLQKPRRAWAVLGECWTTAPAVRTCCGKAWSADTRDGHCLPVWPHSNRATNPGAFLSLQRSSQGSQVQRLMSDSSFPFPEGKCNLQTRNTHVPSPTEACPSGWPGPGPGRASHGHTQAGAMAGPAWTVPFRWPQPPHPHQALRFPLLAFIFLCVWAQEGGESGLGASSGLRGTVRTPRSPGPGKGCVERILQRKMHFSGERKFPKQLPNSANAHGEVALGPALRIPEAGGGWALWAPRGQPGSLQECVRF